jgi:hypothetical protein
MNHDERIVALEVEAADLKRRLARIEAEHLSLNSYAARAAGREKLRDDLDADYRRLTESYDAASSNFGSKSPRGTVASRWRLSMISTRACFRWSSLSVQQMSASTG